MLDSIKHYAENIFTEQILQDLYKLNLTNIQLVEIFTYEAIFSHTKDNLNDVICLLDNAIDYNPNVRYIINKCVTSIVNYTKSNIALHEHFNVKFSDNWFNGRCLSPLRNYLQDKYEKLETYKEKFECQYKVFIEDDVKEFKSILMCENKTTNFILSCFESAAELEAINIIKYLMSMYDFVKEFDDHDQFVYIANPIIYSGNTEMFELLEQAHYDFSKIDTFSIYAYSHQYKLIETISKKYHIKSIKESTETTNSLFYHFIYGIKLSEYLEVKYDLTCIDFTNRDTLFYYNCFNIIKSDKYKYDTKEIIKCVEVAINFYMENKIESVDYVKEAVHHVENENEVNEILSEKLVNYITDDIQAESTDYKNECVALLYIKPDLLSLRDCNRNNMLHRFALKADSKEEFMSIKKYITNIVGKNEIASLSIAKNSERLSPMKIIQMRFEE